MVTITTLLPMGWQFLMETFIPTIRHYDVTEGVETVVPLAKNASWSRKT